MVTLSDSQLLLALFSFAICHTILEQPLYLCLRVFKKLILIPAFISLYRLLNFSYFIPHYMPKILNLRKFVD